MSDYMETLLRKEIDEVKRALEKSVELQSHYADILNMYDGGERMKFKSAEEWIKRLRDIGELPAG